MATGKGGQDAGGCGRGQVLSGHWVEGGRIRGEARSQLNNIQWRTMGPT